VGNRSPRHAWIDDALAWRGRGQELPVTRIVHQRQPGDVQIAGSANADLDERWVRDVLMVGATVESWSDPVLAEITSRFPGLAPYSDGSLFDGLVTSIVGQSISVASAAVTQRRLAFLFDEGVEASVELIRSSGVTTRRADALKRIGRLAADGEIPSDDEARRDPETVETALLGLPQVGKWTAASAVHWGVGASDSWPPGDVALLRAARFSFGDDSLTMQEIDRMAEAWRPNRGVAARLLWTNLFEAMPYSK
jgi:DNA-3-methyladenine glycosylase II